MAAAGQQASPAISIFSSVSVSVTTVKRVPSEPVPAVVGIAISGGPSCGISAGTFQSRMLPPLANSTDMPFAVSIELPPPIATRLSKPPSRNIATPVSITSVVGSETVSENTVNGICALSSSPVARSRMPQRAIYGSVTTSGCLRPSRAISAGNSASAPPPTDISRGIVINAAIAAFSSLEWLFQAEAQNAALLFARLDELTTGCLAKMLEILGGAGIGRQNFEDAAGRQGLQRAPPLQHRQRAQQPCRIERRCRLGCRSAPRSRHD